MLNTVSAVPAAAKSLQSCPILFDPIDGSPQVPLSLGFFRQEHWNGLPFPSPMHVCMLSRLSRVQLCATLWTAAHRNRILPLKQTSPLITVFLRSVKALELTSTSLFSVFFFFGRLNFFREALYLKRQMSTEQKVQICLIPSAWKHSPLIFSIPYKSGIIFLKVDECVLTQPYPISMIYVSVHSSFMFYQFAEIFNDVFVLLLCVRPYTVLQSGFVAVKSSVSCMFMFPSSVTPGSY